MRSSGRGEGPKAAAAAHREPVSVRPAAPKGNVLDMLGVYSVGLPASLTSFS